MPDTIAGMLAKITYLWGDASNVESYKLWGGVLFFVILFATIFVLHYRDKKRKILDPNYRPADLWMLVIRMLPTVCCFFGIVPLIGMAVAALQGQADAIPEHSVFECLVLLALGRVLTLLERRVDKSPSEQADAV